MNSAFFEIRDENHTIICTMVKIAEVYQRLRDDGWYVSRTKGSHRQLMHPKKRGVITLAGKMSDDIKKGTLGSILRRAGLK